MLKYKHKSFKILYKFYTNFPPLYNQTNTSKLYLKFMQKIILNNPRWKLIKQFCKNFLIFLCLISYFYKKTNPNSNKIMKLSLRLFVLPTAKKKFTFLKAPFVNKLAKKHYALVRYKIIISICFQLNKIILVNYIKQLNLFLDTIIKLFSYFESNICYNYKINVVSPFIWKNIK